jgi:predicted permease
MARRAREKLSRHGAEIADIHHSVAVEIGPWIEPRLAGLFAERSLHDGQVQATRDSIAIGIPGVNHPQGLSILLEDFKVAPTTKNLTTFPSPQQSKPMYDELPEVLSMQTASLIADLRYGLRQLRLNPGFASTAIATLALGIGANIALFSVIRNVLLKPLPYREPERIARVWMDNRRLQMREDWASYLNYQDYKRLGTSFESMAAFTEPSLSLIGDGEPERVRGAFAEAELFDVLGAKPIQGRLFTKEEETPGREAVVVIGWGLWQRRFGGGNAMGRVLDFDGRRFTVVGVMPPGFAFPAKKSEFWAPLAVNEQAKRRGGYWLQMVARLRRGTTPAQAQREMDVVGKQLEQQYPRYNAGYGIYVNPLENHVAGNVKTPLLVLLGAVGFVLLIACVNVAGLFLTRA